jgi:transcriptional regulator
MADVVAARNAYMAARERVTETRIALGIAINDARKKGVEQASIAKQLGLTREQVRRLGIEGRQRVLVALPDDGVAVASES